MLDQERKTAYCVLQENSRNGDHFHALALDVPFSIIEEFEDQVAFAEAEVKNTGEDMPKEPHWREHEIGGIILGLFLTKSSLWEQDKISNDHGRYFRFKPKLEALAAHEVAYSLSPHFSLESSETLKWIVNGETHLQ